jgi:hypothetical protein
MFMPKDRLHAAFLAWVSAIEERIEGHFEDSIEETAHHYGCSASNPNDLMLVKKWFNLEAILEILPRGERPSVGLYSVEAEVRDHNSAVCASADGPTGG